MFRKEYSFIVNFSGLIASNPIGVLPSGIWTSCDVEYQFYFTMWLFRVLPRGLKASHQVVL